MKEGIFLCLRLEVNRALGLQTLSLVPPTVWLLWAQGRGWGRGRGGDGGRGRPVSDILMFLAWFVFFTALEMDKNRVIETAPLSFRSLLGVLGIEAALDSLIRLFHTDK